MSERPTDHHEGGSPPSEQPKLDGSALRSLESLLGQDVDPGVDIDPVSSAEAEAGLDDSHSPSGADATPSQADRYEVGTEIARGGMGAILRVRDKDLRRSLAMKVLLGGGLGQGTPGGRASRDHYHRFLEEAQVTAQLAHPGVVPVHELGVDSTGRVYFTMSLVRGETLAGVIEKSRAEEDGWSTTRALQVILRVCETMAFAHSKGVVHRDLKPANVMVGKFGQTYVMDWGLAKVLGREDPHDIRLKDVDPSTLSHVESTRHESEGHDSPIMTMDGAVIGTPAYMPPEQAEGRVDEVDKRSDVYAIGTLLYQLLTGEVPYVGSGAHMTPLAVLVAVAMGPPRAVNEIDPDAPEELQAICEKAMARDRARRYESAEELADDLQRFLSGHVVRAHRTGALIEMKKWVARNTAVAATAAAALIAVAGVTAYFLNSLADERKSVADQRDRALRAEGDAEARAAEALHERDAKNEALGKARVRGLLAESAASSADGNAMLALLLALRAAERGLSPDSVSMLHERLAGCYERICYQGLDGITTRLCIAPDGSHVAAASDRGEVAIWGRAGSMRTLMDAGFGSYPTLEFSPDGASLLVAAEDGAARLMTLDGVELHSLVTEGRGRGACFSPDGTIVAVPAGGGSVVLWRPGDGHTARIDTGTRWTVCRGFIPDGSAVLVTDIAGGAALWSLDGKRLWSVEIEREGIAGAAISADGERFALGTRHGRVLVTDAHGVVLQRLGVGKANVTALSYSPDGQRLAAGGVVAPGVMVWDRDGTLLATLNAPNFWIMSIEWSPDGERLLTSGSNPEVAALFDVTGREVARFGGFVDFLASARFAGDGMTVLVGGDRPPALHDLRGTGLRAFVPPSGLVTRIGYFALGRRLLADCGDGVSIVDTDSGEWERVLLANEEAATGFAQAPGGGRAVVFGADQVRVLEEDGTAGPDLPAHPATVHSARFSADGTQIVTACADGVARVFDPYGTEITRVSAGEGEIRNAWFSPSGDRVLLNSDGGELRFVRLRDGPVTEAVVETSRVYRVSFLSEFRAVLTGEGAEIRDFRDGSIRELEAWTGTSPVGAASADGSLIVVGGADGVAALFDGDGRRITSLLRGQGMVTDVRFSEDGRQIAVAHGSAASLFDRAGRLITRLSGSDGAVADLAFSPDGRRLAVTSRPHVVRQWLTDPQELLELARLRLTRDFTPEEREMYKDLLGD